MKNRIATIISGIFHPLLLPIYGSISLLCLDYFYFYSIFQKIYIVLFVGTSTCVLPLVALLLLKMAGYISNLKVEQRKERYGVYIVSLLSYLILICWLWQSVFLFWIMPLAISVFFVLLTIAIINVFWKISIHASAMGCLAGGVLFTMVLLQITLLWFFVSVVFLSGVVMTARLQLWAHSLSQVLVGYIVGLFFTAILPFFL